MVAPAAAGSQELTPSAIARQKIDQAKELRKSAEAAAHVFMRDLFAPGTEVSEPARVWSVILEQVDLYRGSIKKAGDLDAEVDAMFNGEPRTAAAPPEPTKPKYAEKRDKVLAYFQSSGTETRSRADVIRGTGLADVGSSIRNLIRRGDLEKVAKNAYRLKAKPAPAFPQPALTGELAPRDFAQVTGSGSEGEIVVRGSDL